MIYLWLFGIFIRSRQIVLSHLVERASEEDVSIFRNVNDTFAQQITKILQTCSVNSSDIFRQKQSNFFCIKPVERVTMPLLTTTIFKTVSSRSHYIASFSIERKSVAETQSVADFLATLQCDFSSWSFALGRRDWSVSIDHLWSVQLPGWFRFMNRSVSQFSFTWLVFVVWDRERRAYAYFVKTTVLWLVLYPPFCRKGWKT